MLTPTDTETPAQIDALRNFAAAAELAALERMATSAAASQLRGLRNFADASELAMLEKLAGAAAVASQLHGLQDFAGSPDLTRLNALIAESQSLPDELDWFAIIGEYGRESVHSKFLAWLLNPAAGHGVGDYFLKKFLLHTVAQAEICGIGTATRADIENADWSATTVYLERHRIDILMVNSSNGFVCAIENKIFSPEGISKDGDSQLTWYREVLERDYSAFTKHHVFLSPQGILPAQDKERKFWTPANYTTVRRLVEKTLANNAVTISEEVRVFLRQYATTLRRNIVPEATEIQQLARKIYLEHREAMALIYRHQPDWLPETMQILKEAVAEQKGWRLDKEANGFVRFRSDMWDGFSATRTGTGWAPSPALLLFEFKFSGGRPYLELMLGYGTDEKVREKLFESARQNPAAFRRTANSLVSGYTRLHGEADYILDDSDYGVGWDDGTTRAKIMAWVSDFAQNQFPQMNEVIINCLREYEAEQSRQSGQ